MKTAGHQERAGKAVVRTSPPAAAERTAPHSGRSGRGLGSGGYYGSAGSAGGDFFYFYFISGAIDHNIKLAHCNPPIMVAVLLPAPAFQRVLA